MHVFLVCEVFEMVFAFISDVKNPGQPEIDSRTFLWVKIAMWITPLVMLVIMLLTWFQSRSHIHKIWRHQSELQHDRALQIIALPAVYGLMAMSSLAQLYQLANQAPVADAVAAGASTADAAGSLAQDRSVNYARYETVFMVADLYEAWALYQFGSLTLEVLEATLKSRWSDEWNKKRESDHEVKLSYGAVSQLMWLGTAMFVVVCVIQAGWSLWQWNFGSATSNFEGYASDLRQFRFAGLLASGAAIYNVNVVEHAYSSILGSYSPLLKFVSVKLLVFFSFWQKGALTLAQEVGILQLSELQIELMHSTFLVYECLLSALLHRWAWQAEEPWYEILTDSE
eukprot:CAMPEP_0206567102 /NCGR_PEP_ID=MMETSP0325_2-20121206/25044_1 /ASSEMBLY_ACC=CAM_ASM_000347 /TAXON_ID=2866 /ORGANISM="Crypthecodinium cohnii, Strain Seligo" /LENGTH=340 /DNA_ID=CAMNT_0054070239 /DNA_START=290 /DNA_END=1309 /DNA_ORIENTATION=+